MSRQEFPSGWRLDQITLEGVLPRVFLEEGRRSSDVWLTSLTLKRPRSWMVEAASGTGKSSLCAYLFGSRTDYTGTIRFNGEDVRSLTPCQWQWLRRQSLAYLPQEPGLFPELTALENIRLKNSLTGYATEAQIRRWMDALGVSARADFPAGKMSVGQQQRVGLIRALCQPMDFLLLDEPVSHLDSANNATAAEIVAEEVSRQGASVIATSVGNPIQLGSLEIIRL